MRLGAVGPARALTRISAEHAKDDVPLSDPLPPLGNAVGPVTSDRRAVLWVGSAKPAGTSTSEALGAALVRRLEAAGWDCRTLHAAKVTKLDRAGSPEAVAAARTASVLIVASPVYADCHPVPPDHTRSLSVPIVNPTVFRWLGNMGWLTGSVRQRSLTGLWHRPFAGQESGVSERVPG